MANKITAKIDLKALRKFTEKVSGVKNAFGEEDARALGKEIVAEMKSGISRGSSPVGEDGRFPAYKHAGVKGKYPDSVKGKYPEKRQRPVNLYLSGAFMNALKSIAYRARSGWGVEVGYYDAKSKDKEEGHATGHNGQPKRATIPSDGQEFNARIQRIYLKRFRDAISNFVKGK